MKTFLMIILCWYLCGMLAIGAAIVVFGLFTASRVRKDRMYDYISAITKSINKDKENGFACLNIIINHKDGTTTEKKIKYIGVLITLAIWPYAVARKTQAMYDDWEKEFKEYLN